MKYLYCLPLLLLLSMICKPEGAKPAKPMTWKRLYEQMYERGTKNENSFSTFLEKVWGDSFYRMDEIDQANEPKKIEEYKAYRKQRALHKLAKHLSSKALVPYERSSHSEAFYRETRRTFFETVKDPNKIPDAINLIDKHIKAAEHKIDNNETVTYPKNMQEAIQHCPSHLIEAYQHISSATREEYSTKHDSFFKFKYPPVEKGETDEAYDAKLKKARTQWQQKHHTTGDELHYIFAYLRCESCLKKLFRAKETPYLTWALQDLTTARDILSDLVDKGSTDKVFEKGGKTKVYPYCNRKKNPYNIRKKPSSFWQERKYSAYREQRWNIHFRSWADFLDKQLVSFPQEKQEMITLLKTDTPYEKRPEKTKATRELLKNYSGQITQARQESILDELAGYRQALESCAVSDVISVDALMKKSLNADNSHAQHYQYDMITLPCKTSLKAIQQAKHVQSIYDKENVVLAKADLDNHKASLF